jgi:hypothetical protein
MNAPAYLIRRSAYEAAAAVLPVDALRKWALTHGWVSTAGQPLPCGRAPRHRANEFVHVASQTLRRMADDLAPVERLDVLEAMARLADLHGPVLLHEILTGEPALAWWTPVVPVPVVCVPVEIPEGTTVAVGWDPYGNGGLG